MPIKGIKESITELNSLFAFSQLPTLNPQNIPAYFLSRVHVIYR